MRRLSAYCVIIMSLFFAAGNAHASINVDGRLDDDWGVAPAGWGSTNWNPTNGAHHTDEDQKGDLSAPLGPGVGGQLFDAEAMYYKQENNFIYLAIVTGLPQSGAQSNGLWYPGDIAIDFGGDGIYEYGIKTRAAEQGKFYKNLTAGDWYPGYWGSASSPTGIQNGSGTYVDTISFAYNNDYYWDENSTDYNRHYVMEMAIPESYFGLDWMNGGRIHWTQMCGNDAIDLDVPAVPEPASLALVGLGLAGLLRFRRKKV